MFIISLGAKQRFIPMIANFLQEKQHLGMEKNLILPKI